MSPAILSGDRLTQIDRLIDDLHDEPMLIKRQFDAARQGDDLSEYHFLVAEMECCPYFMMHMIEGASLRDALVTHANHHKLDVLRNATVEDLLQARRRIILNQRAQAAPAGVQ